MSASLKRMVVGSLAALAIGVSAIGATTPASAQVYHHPAGHGPVVRGGHGYGHGGHWHGGGWGPAAVGLGVLGLAAGLAITMDPAPMTTAATRFVPPMTLTAISSGAAGSTCADWREAVCLDDERPRFGEAFSLTAPGHAAFGAGQKTPPCIGLGAPVVVGSESGSPRRERSAR